MNESNNSRLYFAVLTIATMLLFAVLEDLKKVGHLPEFDEDYRLYVITAVVTIDFNPQL